MKNKDLRTITPEILRALRDGDQQAFETVYLRYVTPVRNFLSTLMRSADLGEELTQELFVTLWEKRGNIDPSGSITGYLYIIGRNLAFKALDKRKRSNIGELTSTDNIESGSVSDDVLIEQEMELLIDMAISRMPPKRGEIFNLSRKEGLSNLEIAQRLRISKNTVENHITSALNDICKALALGLALLLMAG